MDPSLAPEACGNKRRWPHAQQLFTALRKRRLQPSDVTVSATLVEPWKGFSGGNLGMLRRRYNVGPPVDSVQLVHITPISIWFMVLITSYNYSIHGVYKPTNITGGPHIVTAMVDSTNPKLGDVQPLFDGYYNLLYKLYIPHLSINMHMKWWETFNIHVWRISFMNHETSKNNQKSIAHAMKSLFVA